MPLRECQQTVTSTEFLEWLIVLDEEERKTNITHWYLMQIAQEVVRSRVQQPAKVKLDSFELKFQSKKPPRKKTKKEREAEWKARRAALLAAHGITT